MSYILGIDEAGRGAWAGPLSVAGVVLGESVIDGLADSKLLSRKQRYHLADLIQADAVAVAVGWASSAEIDRYGLTEATRLAVERVLSQIKLLDYEIIIDGNINYAAGYPNSRCLVKADQTVLEVSAASIMAKTARDDYMSRLGVKFPDFGFSEHVGYGTKKHAQNLTKHGICKEHRTSFKPVAVYLNG